MVRSISGPSTAHSCAPAAAPVKATPCGAAFAHFPAKRAAVRRKKMRHFNADLD